MLLYHLLFTSYTGNESFEKIGITKYTPFERFGIEGYKNYTIKIIDLFDFDTIKECRYIEQSLHKKYKDISYKPLTKDFSGKTECFLPGQIDISYLKKNHNKYVINNDRINDNIINERYIDEKLKINVSRTFNKNFFINEIYTFCDYNSIYSDSDKLTAVLKDNKLYAKELISGGFYILSENTYKSQKSLNC